TSSSISVKPRLLRVMVRPTRKKVIEPSICTMRPALAPAETGPKGVKRLSGTRRAALPLASPQEDSVVGRIPSVVVDRAGHGRRELSGAGIGSGRGSGLSLWRRQDCDTAAGGKQV